MKVPKPQMLPSGRYFMRLRLDGKSYSQTFNTEKEAVGWAYLIKAQHKTNQLKAPPAEQRTLRELIDEYIACSQLAPNTVKSYRAIQHHFRQAMDKPYSQVKGWQKIVSAELEDHNTNTVALWWTIISAVLRFHGLEVPTVKVAKKPSKQKNYLTPDEVKRFCEVIQGHPHEAYFLLMLSSLRVSEAVAVQDEDITETGIHVHGTKTAASDRFVPFMIPRLKEVIYDRPPTHRQTLNRTLSQVCERNGFPPLTCHSLRISFASTCWSRGVPERICMKIGGWQSLQVMHQVYIRISDDDVMRYADTVADVFR